MSFGLLTKSAVILAVMFTAITEFTKEDSRPTAVVSLPLDQDGTVVSISDMPLLDSVPEAFVPCNDNVIRLRAQDNGSTGYFFNSLCDGAYTKKFMELFCMMNLYGSDSDVLTVGDVEVIHDVGDISFEDGSAASLGLFVPKGSRCVRGEGFRKPEPNVPSGSVSADGVAQTRGGISNRMI